MKSGLEDRFHSESDVPRVSQYRLAAHLGSAFVLYAFFLWSALDKLVPLEKFERTKQIMRFRMVAHMGKGMIFLTALSGKYGCRMCMHYGLICFICQSVNFTRC